MSSLHESSSVKRLTVILCALVCAGCGKPVSAPKDSASTPAAATDQLPAVPASPAVDAAEQIRTDADGRQYLGNVPLDVFFDAPLEVASDNTPVESTATDVRPFRRRRARKHLVTRRRPLQIPRCRRSTAIPRRAQQSTGRHFCPPKYSKPKSNPRAVS